jgi:hypothetical protein
MSDLEYTLTVRHRNRIASGTVANGLGLPDLARDLLSHLWAQSTDRSNRHCPVHWHLEPDGRCECRTIPEWTPPLPGHRA